MSAVIFKAKSSIRRSAVFIVVGLIPLDVGLFILPPEVWWGMLMAECVLFVPIGVLTLNLVHRPR